MADHQVVVVFDVIAPSRERAALAVTAALAKDALLPCIQHVASSHDSAATVESWWLPEADLKHVDGNDNAVGRLVFDLGERYPTYAVGEPDPSPDDTESLCMASKDGRFACTWPAGHDHPQHVAGTGERIAAVWPVSA